MSAARNYVPQQGTLSAKVIDYLKSQPAGAQVPTQVLLDAIGQPDMKNIRSYMLPAIGAGLVSCTRVSGERSLQWSLASSDRPDGISQQHQASDATAATHDDLADLAGPAPNPDLTRASVFALAQAASIGTPQAEPEADQAAATDLPPGGARKPWPFKREAIEVPAAAPCAVAPGSSTTPGGFRCALFSDGQLMIKTGDLEAVLPVEHTRQLLHYLDRIRFDEHSVGGEPK